VDIGDDPTDYVRIFKAADGVLARVMDRPDRQGVELCLHLSPGTPAMTAIWVLLGKSRYPATFYQTHHRRGAWRTEIPFDLVVDFVPELFRDMDHAIVRLASASPAEVAAFESIIGQSQAMRLAVERAMKAALHDVPVLLLGETGTGKGMFARAVHKASPRQRGPFVALSCAAIPKDLLESELFGHDKGAFTGAVAPQPGAFERAHGGILFLDEVGECPVDLQAKLLHALDPIPGGGLCDLRIQRLGGTVRECNVRVLAATNRDLSVDVAQNRFRRDLYHRLAVIRLKLPPLRDRKTDIERLVHHLVSQINRHLRQKPGYKDKSVSKGTVSFAVRQPWPGNVRQLYNALLQAAVMAEGDTIRPSDLAAAVAEMPDGGKADLLEEPLGDGFSLERHLQGIQRHYLIRAMEESGGVKSRAAKLLGIEKYQTLDAQLKRLGVVTGGRERP
jgi:transcriptional regulator with GAF, ATPase, and Fis domain